MTLIRQWMHCLVTSCKRSTSGSCTVAPLWWSNAVRPMMNWRSIGVYQAIYNFATVDLSSVYFDVLKDRLYTTAARSKERGRSAQTAMYRVTYALARLAAPILAFTTEEVWSNMRLPAGAPGSVHIALAPQAEELTAGLSGDSGLLQQNWERLLSVRDQVLKDLEAARNAKLIGRAHWKRRSCWRPGSPCIRCWRSMSQNCRGSSSLRRWSCAGRRVWNSASPLNARAA